jgi:hypothetical protein
MRTSNPTSSQYNRNPNLPPVALPRAPPGAKTNHRTPLPRADSHPPLPPTSATVGAALGAEGAGVEERRHLFGAARAASATFGVGRGWGGVPNLAAAALLADGGGFAAGLGPPPRPVVLWRPGGV